MKTTHTQNKRISALYTFFMREAEENEEEKELEGGKKCVKERMKHVRGVNNNGTKYVSWTMDMTTLSS
jgi:hypothetical protein